MKDKILFQQRNYIVPPSRLVLFGNFLKLPENEKIGSLTIDHYWPGTGGQIKLNTLPEYKDMIMDFLPLALGILGVYVDDNLEIIFKKNITRGKEEHFRGRIGPKRFKKL